MIETTAILLRFVGWQSWDAATTWTRPANQTHFYNLWYIVQGQGQVSDGHDSISLSPGDALLFPNHSIFHATHNPEQPLTVCYSHFEVDNDENLVDWLESSNAPVGRIALDDREFAQQLFRRCWSTYHQHANSTQAVSWLRCGLLEVFRQRERQQRTSLAGPHGHALEKLCRQIREAPQLHWDSKRMAQVLDISVSHLTRLFHTVIGTTPHAYVVRIRVQAAKSQLLYTQDTVEKIANKFGYPDPFTFSKQFRKVVGQSPSTWRQQRS